MIAQRTRDALAAAKAKGKKLGGLREYGRAANAAAVERAKALAPLFEELAGEVSARDRAHPERPWRRYAYGQAVVGHDRHPGSGPLGSVSSAVASANKYPFPRQASEPPDPAATHYQEPIGGAGAPAVAGPGTKQYHRAGGKTDVRSTSGSHSWPQEPSLDRIFARRRVLLPPLPRTTNRNAPPREAIPRAPIASGLTAISESRRHHKSGVERLYSFDSLDENDGRA
jgi:hypothetical protein